MSFKKYVTFVVHGVGAPKTAEEKVDGATATFANTWSRRNDVPVERNVYTAHPEVGDSVEYSVYKGSFEQGNGTKKETVEHEVVELQWADLSPAPSGAIGPVLAFGKLLYELRNIFRGAKKILDEKGNQGVGNYAGALGDDLLGILEGPIVGLNLLLLVAFGLVFASIENLKDAQCAVIIVGLVALLLSWVGYAWFKKLRSAMFWFGLGGATFVFLALTEPLIVPWITKVLEGFSATKFSNWIKSKEIKEAIWISMIALGGGFFLFEFNTKKNWIWGKGSSYKIQTLAIALLALGFVLLFLEKELVTGAGVIEEKIEDILTNFTGLYAYVKGLLFVITAVWVFVVLMYVFISIIWFVRAGWYRRGMLFNKQDPEDANNLRKTFDVQIFANFLETRLWFIFIPLIWAILLNLLPDDHNYILIGKEDIGKFKSDGAPMLPLNLLLFLLLIGAGVWSYRRFLRRTKRRHLISDAKEGRSEPLSARIIVGGPLLFFLHLSPLLFLLLFFETLFWEERVILEFFRREIVLNIAWAIIAGLGVLAVAFREGIRTAIDFALDVPMYFRRDPAPIDMDPMTKLLRRDPAEVYPEKAPIYEQIQSRFDAVIGDVCSRYDPDQVLFVTHSQGTTLMGEYLLGYEDRKRQSFPSRWGEADWFPHVTFLTMGSPISDIYQYYFDDYFGRITYKQGAQSKVKQTNIDSLNRIWYNLYRDSDQIGRYVNEAQNHPIGFGDHNGYFEDERVHNYLDAFELQASNENRPWVLGREDEGTGVEMEADRAFWNELAKITHEIPWLEDEGEYDAYRLIPDKKRAKVNGFIPDLRLRKPIRGDDKESCTIEGDVLMADGEPLWKFTLDLGDSIKKDTWLMTWLFLSKEEKEETKEIDWDTLNERVARRRWRVIVRGFDDKDKVTHLHFEQIDDQDAFWYGLAKISNDIPWLKDGKRETLLPDSQKRLIIGLTAHEGDKDIIYGVEIDGKVHLEDRNASGLFKLETGGHAVYEKNGESTKDWAKLNRMVDRREWEVVVKDSNEDQSDKGKLKLLFRPRPNIEFMLTADDYGISNIIDKGVDKAIAEGLINSVACFANVPEPEKSGAEKTEAEKSETEKTEAEKSETEKTEAEESGADNPEAEKSETEKTRTEKPGAGKPEDKKTGSFTVEKVKRLKKKYPNVKIGLHFTIASGNRVSKEAVSLSPKRWGRVLDRFKSVFMQPRHATEEDLIKELNAQIKIFEDAGIEIEHFSDHYNVLTNTRKGTRALIKVVGKYNERNGLDASIRNPRFISQMVSDENNCLDNSKVQKQIRWPVTFTWIMNGIMTILGRKGNGDSLILFTKDHQEDNWKRIREKEIRTTDYLVETYYGSQDKDTIRCIFDTENYPPLEVEPTSKDGRRTAEVILHLGEKYSRQNNREDIREIKAYRGTRRGINIRYVRNGRYKELKALRDHLAKYHRLFDNTEG